MVFDSTDVQVLTYLNSHKQVRYRDLLKHVAKTRGMLAISLRELRRKKLIERIINQSTTPIESSYILTERGIRAVQLLNELEKLVT